MGDIFSTVCRCGHLYGRHVGLAADMLGYKVGCQEELHNAAGDICACGGFVADRSDADGVDPEFQRRGRNNRLRGNSHELKVARKFGGEKVGPLGLPEDIRGTEFRTQVKTYQRLAPAGWRKAFAALEATVDARTPRLILRFLRPGVPADDYIVFRGQSFLDRYGKDE